MLSGMIAGGMTSAKYQDWKDQDLANTLNEPSSGLPNTNPAEAVKLVRVKAGDYQDSEVGKQLPIPLQVQAQDKMGKPVKGVKITFTVITGVDSFLH